MERSYRVEGILVGKKKRVGYFWTGRSAFLVAVENKDQPERFGRARPGPRKKLTKKRASSENHTVDERGNGWPVPCTLAKIGALLTKYVHVDTKISRSYWPVARREGQSVPL
jgi:hypothetical protein